MNAQPAEASLPGAQWVRVEFHGLVPHGQVVTDVDPLEVAATLMTAFGFTSIAALTIAAVPE